jgi:hypothetical protein
MFIPSSLMAFMIGAVIGCSILIFLSVMKLRQERDFYRQMMNENLELLISSHIRYGNLSKLFSEFRLKVQDSNSGESWKYSDN